MKRSVKELEIQKRERERENWSPWGSLWKMWRRWNSPCSLKDNDRVKSPEGAEYEGGHITEGKSKATPQRQ